MSQIAFIGLGTMGRPMAARLQAGGHDLFVVKHKSPLPRELLEGGATECRSHNEAAERAEIILTIVPDTAEVAEVLFAADGVAAGLSPGKMVVDMSSISPVATRDFAARIGKLGCDYVDAPVSGGDIGAKAGTLSIMAGGSEKAFARAQPLFALMGERITRVGEVGAGQTCKVANQIVVALTIEAVSEALVLVAKAGVDPARVREALLGGFAGSRILEVHGQRMIDRNFKPGFTLALQQKDLGIALATARALGVSLPNTAAVQELYNACAARGDAGLDHSALATALERLADHEIGPKR